MNETTDPSQEPKATDANAGYHEIDQHGEEVHHQEWKVTGDILDAWDECCAKADDGHLRDGFPSLELSECAGKGSVIILRRQDIDGMSRFHIYCRCDEADE